MPIKCVLSLNGQCYVQTLYDFWSVSRSSNRILLQPFDCVFVSCKLICGIEWPLRVTMLFLYPTPYPFKDGSHGENECSNSLTRDGTKIIALFCYMKLGWIYTMQNKFSNCFVCVSQSTLDLEFHLLSWRYKRRSFDKNFHLKKYRIIKRSGRAKRR